jgi:hypothetical protein
LALNRDVYSASCHGYLTPGEESLVPTGQEAGWAPELVWVLWSTEKYVAPAGNASKLSFFLELLKLQNILTIPNFQQPKETKNFLFTKLLL